ncbi:MAG: hypothetical protein IKE75_00260 [Bacilli bacterium]|nr:hypothetical protein [Bacilli bacterium]
MENKSTGKTVIIVILLLSLLGLGGYVVYDKVLNKETGKKTNEQVTKEEKQEKNTNFNLSKKTMIQRLNGDSYTLYISKEGEALLTVENYDDNQDETIKNTIAELQKEYQLNTLKGYCNTDGELAKEICPDGDAVKSIKLNIDNVVAAYDTKSGQELGGSYIIFLKSDGTISRLNIANLLYKGKLDIENNVASLKNIVTIVQSSSTGIPSGYAEVLAIEKDGTQHSLINTQNNNS